MTTTGPVSGRALFGEVVANITDKSDNAGICVDRRTPEMKEADLQEAADGKDGRCKFDRPNLTYGCRQKVFVCQDRICFGTRTDQEKYRDKIWAKEEKDDGTVHDLLVGMLRALSAIFFLAIANLCCAAQKQPARNNQDDEEEHQPAPQENRTQEVERKELGGRLDEMEDEEEDKDGEMVFDLDMPEEEQPLRKDSERLDGVRVMLNMRRNEETGLLAEDDIRSTDEGSKLPSNKL